jgi:hypothetical protein
MRIVFPLIIILAAAYMFAGCDQEVASPGADQLLRGQVIYEQGCATSTCHGVAGEGILEGDEFRVWPLVGEAFQRRNPTAQVIFDVVRSGGEPSLRALTDQQIYDSIAYELSLNGVQNIENLTSQNAGTFYSGNSVKAPKSGSLFPPPDNAQLVAGWSAPALPLCGEDSELRLCVTQIAMATSIGENKPSNGGRYVLIVSMMEVLANHSIEVGPQYLRLVDQGGMKFEPIQIDLDYPVVPFYAQVIEPEHGTSFLSMFALPETSALGYLLYSLPDDQELRVELIP